MNNKAYYKINCKIDNKINLSLFIVTLLVLIFAFTGCQIDHRDVANTLNTVSKTAEESANQVVRADTESLPRFRDDEMLREHYQKHVIEQKEFGDITIDEYLKKAQNLVSSEDGQVLKKTEEDGDFLFYRESTNEYAVLSTDGYIRTYFKPSRGADYL